MKDTIKAKHEYIVKRATDKIEGTEFRILYDGDEFVMAAYAMSREVFTTRTGKQFVYARDEELDADYLINV